MDPTTLISGDEVSMLRILKRQRRLSLPKATDMTGFEAQRCKSALEGLREKNFAVFESNEYWITAEGSGYLAYTKAVKKP